MCDIVIMSESEKDKQIISIRNSYYWKSIMAAVMVLFIYTCVRGGDFAKE